MLRYLIMLNIMFVFALSNAKTIIFDLHGVLLERCTQRTGSHLGFLNCASYYMSSSFNLEDRCQEFLKLLEQHETASKLKDQPMPKVIAEWLKGEKKAADMIKEIKAHADKAKDFFQSNLEETLIRSVIDLMSPENLAFVVKPMKDMVRLVEECKIQKDKNGKPKHNLLILSNWDKESFPLIKKKCIKLFKHFDEKNIVISGEVNMLKPDKAIYEHILKKHKLDPSDCIYIDDQEENIKIASSECKIKSIHHKDYKTTRQKLIEFGFIEDKRKAKSKTKTNVSFKKLFE